MITTLALAAVRRAVAPAPGSHTTPRASTAMRCTDGRESEIRLARAEIAGAVRIEASAMAVSAMTASRDRSAWDSVRRRVRTSVSPGTNRASLRSASRRAASERMSAASAWRPRVRKSVPVARAW